MGTYTELLVKCDIYQRSPLEVMCTLKYLFGDRDNTHILKKWPDHPFFKKERWEAIGSCSSAYHIPANQKYFDGSYLFCRCDLKNYDNEIEAFLDWIDPYIQEPKGKVIGWIWHEEYSSPTLILKGLTEIFIPDFTEERDPLEIYPKLSPTPRYSLKRD